MRHSWRPGLATVLLCSSLVFPLAGTEAEVAPLKLPKLWMIPIGRIGSVVISPNGEMIVTHSDSHSHLTISDRDSREDIRKIESCSVQLLGFTPDSKRIVTLEGHPPTKEKFRTRVCLWDVSTGKQVGDAPRPSPAGLRRRSPTHSGLTPRRSPRSVDAFAPSNPLLQPSRRPLQ